MCKICSFTSIECICLLNVNVQLVSHFDEVYIFVKKKNENLRILNFAKSPNSEIRENLNTRKLPDLQYSLSYIQ